MNLFSLIAAMLLEQLQPISTLGTPSVWQSAYAGFFRHHFNAGEYSHGKVAWLLAVVPVLLVVAFTYWWLHAIHPFLSMVFNFLVLYFCLDFGRYSHLFANIRLALISGRMEEARTLLSQWRKQPSQDMNGEEIARVTIEAALVAALRHLFAVVLWFVLFSLIGLGGAVGAVLYRFTQILRENWQNPSDSIELNDEAFDGFARKMLYLLEWLPIRLTAATFAISGNFEDTVYCWRSQATSWHDAEIGILLASAAGASGVRLGSTIPCEGGVLNRPELGVGDKTDATALQCTIRLIGRSTVVWMILFFMFTLAGVLG